MYLPKQFEETSVPVLFDLIKAHPLATVITHSSPGMNANHIPLLLADNGGGQNVLRGHVARANPLLNDLARNPETLVVFQGAEHYITPSWYATKQETEKVVPTWNYVVVHVRGTMHMIDEAQWLHQQLLDLTVQQESARSKPWSVNDAPADFLDQIKKAIVGVEIKIDHIVGKWKVSQNQPPKNRASVVEGLAELGTDSAHAMRQWVEQHL